MIVALDLIYATGLGQETYWVQWSDEPHGLTGVVLRLMRPEVLTYDADLTVIFGVPAFLPGLSTRQTIEYWQRYQRTIEKGRRERPRVAHDIW